tara:strand:+ start:171 stop:293 length:123 start_codon:yes stop_codon:yes gene_type:complete
MDKYDKLRLKEKLASKKKKPKTAKATEVKEEEPKKSKLAE